MQSTVDLSFQLYQVCGWLVGRALEHPLLVAPLLVTRNLVWVEQNMELSSNRIHRYNLYEKTLRLLSNAKIDFNESVISVCARKKGALPEQESHMFLQTRQVQE